MVSRPDGQLPPEPGADDEAEDRPSGLTVARRALCLAAGVQRGWIEHDVQLTGAVTGAHDKVAHDLQGWILAEGLEPALSTVERANFAKPVGQWSQREIVNASWSAEALGVLTWALGALHDLPAYDVQVDPFILEQVVPLFGPVRPWVEGSQLRPVEIIERARDLAELWHWRSRTTKLVRTRPDVQPPNGLTFAQIIATAADGAHARGDLTAPIRQDFPAFGRAYAELTDDQYSQVTSIAMERHRALNWLCGYSEDWDEVPTDT